MNDENKFKNMYWKKYHEYENLKKQLESLGQKNQDFTNFNITKIGSIVFIHDKKLFGKILCGDEYYYFNNNSTNIDFNELKINEKYKFKLVPSIDKRYKNQAFIIEKNEPIANPNDSFFDELIANKTLDLTSNPTPNTNYFDLFLKKKDEPTKKVFEYDFDKDEILLREHTKDITKLKEDDLISCMYHDKLTFFLVEKINEKSVRCFKLIMKKIIGRYYFEKLDIHSLVGRRLSVYK
jgi:hypothetical protein